MPLVSPASELAAALDPGERLLWSGAPRGGLRLRPQDAYVIPFSLVWCGFAIFWTYSATRGGAPVFFTLWGLMFVGIGLFFVFGRFFADALRRKNTVYGITDRRVLLLSGRFTREIRSIDPRAVSEITLVLHRDATGTITFGSSLFPGGSLRGWPGATRTWPPAFEFIDAPHDVHRLVLALKSS